MTAFVRSWLLIPALGAIIGTFFGGVGAFLIYSTAGIFSLINGFGQHFIENRDNVLIACLIVGAISGAVLNTHRYRKKERLRQLSR